MSNKIAAIIGGGVIGGGWAARFLLHGWHVKVYDPAADAQRKIEEVLANARASLPKLSDVSLPKEGQLTFCDNLEAAVAEASWIQESVPERLDIKLSTLAAIQAACSHTAIIGSSTSGFKPSELQQEAARPAQIMVAHPFNPVYLLPLVELVPSEQTDTALLNQAKDLLTSIGMKPLHVRKEIDAHIADRLLEAVWREGLWLINDGVATTEEIDDAIRYGFGLRWAQMGLFETYRIAGGEAGMAHFIAQFGPCLQWPWSKLTDVPELTDQLVQTIADQSDAQSGQHSIRELERIRDNNLIGIMRAQKQTQWGVGELLNAHDKRLKELE
ncbi:MAG: 3-hydroxyacyl-CoA dehydrogenase NAD-binding domain-containing protein [Pseudomonadales bacterium]|jgi:carnitine 3-dehydrogenase